jgi:hypothetical protein
MNAKRGSGDHDARTVLPEGTAPPGQVPAGIFAAAVDVFASGQRLDMRSLARRLGGGGGPVER